MCSWRDRDIRNERCWRYLSLLLSRLEPKPVGIIYYILLIYEMKDLLRDFMLSSLVVWILVLIYVISFHISEDPSFVNSRNFYPLSD